MHRPPSRVTRSILTHPRPPLLPRKVQHRPPSALDLVPLLSLLLEQRQQAGEPAPVVEPRAGAVAVVEVSVVDFVWREVLADVPVLVPPRMLFVF